VRLVASGLCRDERRAGRNHGLVVRIVLLQAGCALIAASLFLVFKGASAGLAALAGGLIVAVGSAVFGWRAFKPGIAGADARHGDVPPARR
jgi:F0F1-type ATP synthase assembly protein I